MKIIRARIKQVGLQGEYVSTVGRIKNLIEKADSDDTFHFVIDDNGIKTAKEFGPENIDKNLINKRLQLINSNYYVYFNEDGSISITTNTELNESLPRQRTVDQLKKLRKLTKGVDIGDRISKNNKMSNISYNRNPIDSGIESYEDFEKKNKDFIPSWNLKHLKSPFKK